MADHDARFECLLRLGDTFHDIPEELGHM